MTTTSRRDGFVAAALTGLLAHGWTDEAPGRAVKAADDTIAKLAEGQPSVELGSHVYVKIGERMCPVSPEVFNEIARLRAELDDTKHAWQESALSKAREIDDLTEKLAKYTGDLTDEQVEKIAVQQGVPRLSIRFIDVACRKVRSGK